MSEVGKSDRGIFRSISMDDLRVAASLPIWKETPSNSRYGYPLRTAGAGKLLKMAREIARQDPAIAEHDLKMVGPFLTVNSPETHIGPFNTAIDFCIQPADIILLNAGLV